MPTSAACPRCHVSLKPSATDDQLMCPVCLGIFEVRAEPTTEPSATRPVSGHVVCPGCSGAMQQTGEDATRWDCPVCGGRWQDGTALAAKIDGEPALAAVARTLLYGVSLPERLIRSGVGLTAGTVKEIAELIVPQAFQTSKSYEIAIDNSLRFLTESIGGVTSAAPSTAEDKSTEQIARKAVGNFVDLAGLATLHVSPMWILAAVSDAAYGTRTYVKEVARELERRGVIDETSTIHHMDDILDAIQRASGSAASTFDQPPLSVAELRATLDQTRRDLNRADLTKILPEAEIRRLWEEMQAAATQEDVDLLTLSGAVTMRTLDRMKLVGDSAVAGIWVAGDLLNRNIIGHYRESVRSIQADGIYATIRESYEPYVAAVWNNFSHERSTWTEAILNPQHVSSAMDRVRRLFGGSS